MSKELPITGLYAVARDTCFDCGMSWTDPRTGKTYHPPGYKKPKKGKKDERKSK